MRVLLTVPGVEWGGIEHRVLEQTRWLAQQGFAPLLAAPEGETIKRARALGLDVRPFSFKRPYALSTILAFRGLVRAEKIAVIDTRGGRDGTVALLASDLAGVTATRHVAHPLKANWRRRLRWKRFHHFIATSALARDKFIADGLADPARTALIGEWAEDAFFVPPDSNVLNRLRMGMNLASGPVLLCVGMLRSDKGQDLFLEALSLIKDMRMTALIAGAPTGETQPYAESLYAQSERLGLKDKVRFLGYREDVADLMALADLVVVPSRAEAQSRVIPQAFARGKAVAAFRVGGIGELVEPGKTGWLAEPENASDLARILREPLSAPERLAAYGQTCAQLAQSRLRMDHAMEQTLGIWRQAAKAAGRSV